MTGFLFLMQRIIHWILFILPIYLPIASASSPGGEDVLRPSLRSVLVGPVIGGAYTFSLGSFETTCNCDYQHGGGFGFLFGGVVEYPFTHTISLVGELSFRNASTSYSKSDARSEYLVSEATYVTVDYTRTADVSNSLLGLRFLVKVNAGVGGLYMLGGPALGVVMFDHIFEKEVINSPGVVYQINQQASQTYLNAALNSLFSPNRLRFALDTGIGYEFNITPKVLLTPQFTISLPLTSIVAEYQTWKIATLDLSASLNFAM